MRILILGRRGQVGFRLERSLQCLGSVVAYDRESYDYEKPETVLDIVRAVRPDVVVNAAAWTAVDLAEEHRPATMQVNAHTPLALAQECATIGALFVTFSTDYVFGSVEPQPILETRSRAPLNFYGESKAVMEEGLESLGASFLNFRTTWVYDSRGKNFLLTMLRLFQDREQVKVVDDQVGAPTSAQSLAAAVTLVLTRLSHSKGSWQQKAAEVSGHYHLSNAGQTTWYAFAQRIRERAVDSGKVLKLQSLEGIASSLYPTPAARPMYSVLDNTKVREVFGVQMPSWETTLDRVFEELT